MLKTYNIQQSLSVFGHQDYEQGGKSMKVRKLEDLMSNNVLVKHYAGSHAYGTALPTSDVDFRGIFCCDPVNLLTPFFPVRECFDTSEQDTKLYELAHFMKLCLDCNPNIIETLWVDDCDVVIRTPAYDLLRQHRQKLLSSKVAFTFSGYGVAQLKRIQGHNKWINNPMAETPPRQVDFVSLVQWFGNQKIMPSDFNLWQFCFDFRLVPYGGEIYGLYRATHHQTYSDDFTLNTTFEGERHTIGLPLAIVKFNKEQYKLAHEKWEQYWIWKKNRNIIRSQLEEKYGYDTKHACHLFRLLKMCVEILRDGEVIVKRPDAQELIDIRNGSLTYQEIVLYAEEMDKQIRDVWYKKTSLPKRPDIKFAAELLMEVQNLVWYK